MDLLVDITQGGHQDILGYRVFLLLGGFYVEFLEELVEDQVGVD
jgi:hypothetical protein